MRLSTLIVALVSAVSALPQPEAPATFERRVIFTPPSNYTDPRVLYARSEQFDDGTLLATWENYSPEPPNVYFPIYESTDGGFTWAEISRVQDTQQDWGLRYQPFLYILQNDLGGFAKGTVLLAGSSIPTDLSLTQLDLYASTDRGYTWEFVSALASGGEARPINGLTPVWEPFLLEFDGKLIHYYADQRDPEHGQKLSHQTSSDLRTWGAVVEDVAEPTYTDRPGMPTVALLPNGQYIYAYEYGGGPAIPTRYTFPVYVKLSADPEAFGPEAGISVQTANGTIPNGSPYIVWSPVGGRNGTIILSAASNTEIFINKNLGQGLWTSVPTPEIRSYTRHLRVLKDPSKLLILGAGVLPPSTTNRVQLSVIDICNL